MNERRLHFRALDGMRFVGALAVMTTHAAFDSGDALRGPMAGLLARLDAGVALFFVVSGFLLFRPHAMAHLESRRRPRTGTYLVRRAVRILPVLWIAVLAAFVLLRDPAAGVAPYLAHATLTHIYLDVPLLAGLTQFWSLATEVAFYLLLPLAAWALCRGPRNRIWVARSIGILVALVVVGPAWMATATAMGASQARLWLPGFVGWFAVGMMLAVWHSARTLGLLSAGRIDTLAGHPGTVWALAGALFVVSSTQLAGPVGLSEPLPGQAATKNVLYALIALLVVLPTVARVGGAPEPRAVRPLSTRAGVWLGQISYGVFAYHVIVLALLGRVDGLAPFTGGFWVRWFATLLLTLGIASASYVLLERPLMRLVRERRSHRRPGHTASTPRQSASHTRV
jgi:peptidoglycan/LPS O-acetylase OafA/YrhL